MKNFNTIVTVLSIALATSGAADSHKKDTTVSIDEALSAAYEANSELQAALRQQYATHESINQAISGFRPSVTASGQMGRSRTRTNTPPGSPIDRVSTQLDPRSAQIQVSQNLYTGGGSIAGYKSAISGVEAGFYRLMNTEQDVLLKAASAYLNILFTEESIAFNKANVTFLSEQLRANKAAVEVGEKTRTDVAQSESRLAEAQADLIAAEGEKQKAYATYVQVVGLQPGKFSYPQSLKGHLPNSRDETIEKTAKANPAVLQAEYAFEQAQHQIRVASSELLPKVNASVTGSRSLNNSRQGDQINSANVTFQLSVPIYQSGARWSQTRQQEQTAAAARFSLEQARKVARENAVSAWEGLVTARKRINQFKQQVKFATISRDGAREEANVGERAALDVLDFQRELLRAQLGLVRAKRDERLAEYQVLAVQGELTASTLRLPVTYYNVREHMKNVRYKWFGFASESDTQIQKDEEE